VRIVYGYDAVLPTKGADSEQVMNTVASASRAGADIDLLTVRPRQGAMSEEELKEHYGVHGPFRIEQMGRAWPLNRTAEKLAHAWRVTRDPRTGGDTILHTRHLSMARAALARGRRVLYETYRPWPEQHPSMRAWCVRLLSNPKVVGAIMHSQYAADAFIAAGVPSEKISVIHNGWDPQRFEPRMSREEARKLLDLPLDGGVVTYTGNVSPNKGLDVLLDMAKLCPDVTFFIVGSQGKGPLETRGESIPNVRFVPWQPYTMTTRYLYASDILAIPPSLRALEQAGNTVLPMKTFQYLAAGRVILSGETPDVTELLRNDHNAVLVPPGDVQTAANAVKRILSDTEMANRVSANALADAQRLTWDARGERILEFIRERTEQTV
tara:strand:+ start:111132 stop:112274 length:1143 start_codon:yes stop_codon:yes gene_type:complete